MGIMKAMRWVEERAMLQKGEAEGRGGGKSWRGGEGKSLKMRGIIEERWIVEV